MDEAEDLVITPFREIVEKARLALQNAEDHPVMHKAASDLIREGERGLKRIEPLCKKHLDDYGSNFIVSLKDSDDIATYRGRLNELLWDLDDYIEVASFDESRFAEIKAASREAAPKIVEILQRMKMDVPFGPNFGANFKDDISSRGSMSQKSFSRLSVSTPASPPALLPPSPGHRDSESTMDDRCSVKDPNRQLGDLMPPVNIPEHTPTSPLGNPWDWKLKEGDNRTPEEILEAQRIAEDESPILPYICPDPVVGSLPMRPPPITIPIPRMANDELANNIEDSHYIITPSSSGHNHYSSSYQRPRAPTIPENGPPSPLPHYPPVNSSPYLPTRPQHTASISISSDTSAFGDFYRNDLTTVQTNDSNISGFNPVQPPIIPFQGSVPEELRDQPGLEAVLVENLVPIECGLIPVESEFGPEGRRDSKASNSGGNSGGSIAADPDTVIDQNSSFMLAKGFCSGAEEVIMGKAGVRRIKKPVGFASSATVARCTSCLYELDFNEIEADVNKQSKGNFTRSGINFRIRFLQKSHVAIKRVDDIQYACIFCVKQGHTLNKSDATIFFNQKALFDHISRHPRPLPEIPGLTVIETAQLPDEHKNDYDLHLRSSVQRHPCIERAEEIAQLPSGVAKDHARRMYTQRLLYDRSPALELAAGARITGITWPEQYNGEWCFGWHDGNWASIPTDLVRLDPPPEHQIPKHDRTSLVRAKARWKFVIKDKENKDKVDWLKFEKNETISHITWTDINGWCWSGTNSKGKTGIFPRSYLDTSQVEQCPQSSPHSRADSVNEEKNRGGMNFFGLPRRKNSSGNSQRPPSLAPSTGSRETRMTATTTNASISTGSSTSARSKRVPGDFGMFTSGHG